MIFAHNFHAMDQKDEILEALSKFDEETEIKEIPSVLERFLSSIAKTGETIYPWSKMKRLFTQKLEISMKKFFEESNIDNLPSYPNVENVKYEELSARILIAVDTFTGAPFTIQRLCELITEPKRHYKRTDKFLRGIEKNVMVVSTVDPMGRKITSDPRIPIVNGMDANGHNNNAMLPDATVFQSPMTLNMPSWSPPTSNWITSQQPSSDTADKASHSEQNFVSNERLDDKPSGAMGSGDARPMSFIGNLQQMYNSALSDGNPTKQIQTSNNSQKGFEEAGMSVSQKQSSQEQTSTAVEESATISEQQKLEHDTSSSSSSSTSSSSSSSSIDERPDSDDASSDTTSQISGNQELSFVENTAQTPVVTLPTSVISSSSSSSTIESGIVSESASSSDQEALLSTTKFLVQPTFSTENEPDVPEKSENILHENASFASSSAPDNSIVINSQTSEHSVPEDKIPPSVEEEMPVVPDKTDDKAPQESTKTLIRDSSDASLPRGDEPPAKRIRTNEMENNCFAGSKMDENVESRSQESEKLVETDILVCTEHLRDIQKAQGKQLSDSEMQSTLHTEDSPMEDAISEPEPSIATDDL